LLALVRSLLDDVGAALLVGHNPDLQELTSLLTGREVEMKTSSVAVLAWPGGWTDTEAGTAVLRHHVTPRG
jgi:phosphohistidine phosphatase